MQCKRKTQQRNMNPQNGSNNSHDDVNVMAEKTQSHLMGTTPPSSAKATKPPPMSATASNKSQSSQNRALTQTLKPKPKPTLTQIQGMLETVDDHMECPICLDTLTETHIVPSCQHRFCGGCIKQSLSKCNNECPSCRVHIPTRRSLRPDPVFDTLVRSSVLCCVMSCYAMMRCDVCVLRSHIFGASLLSLGITYRLRTTGFIIKNLNEFSSFHPKIFISIMNTQGGGIITCHSSGRS